MKVFINKRIPKIGIEMLEESGLEVIIPENDNLSHDEWLKYCQNADVILNVGQHKYEKDFLRHVPM